MDAMLPPDILKICVFAVFAYLLGSIPSGFWLTRFFLLKDIRQFGSGNIGATNVARIAGIKLGLATLLADAAKGALPVLAAQLYFHPDMGIHEVAVSATALAAVLGHLYPWVLGFKGGKGVATAAGCFMMISPLGCLGAAVIFLFMVMVSNRVSVGSISGALALPLGVWGAGASPAAVFSAAVIACLIIAKHDQNIRRLIAGTEPKFR